MRFIPTKIHGILDYLVAVLLISSPWLFRFNLGGWETWIPVALGVSAIVYSLITKYEAGIWDLIPMRSHLVIDFVSGFLLFFSPWIFGFNIHVFLPHLIMGLVEMGASIMTKQVPSTSYKDKFIHQV